MTDIVDQTLKLWRTTAFIYGTSDCLLSIGDYLVGRGAPDAGALFRGTYNDEAGAMAHVTAYGGPHKLLDLFGLPPIDPADTMRGDVVVIDPGDGGSSVGALITGDSVAARLERGVIEVRRRFVIVTHAWKVGR